ncbi:MAG: uracil-DNA glycosylase [Lentisphaerae bacterium]|nr:uracil-DNA glycosylase [Lentisphaerota bacterium]
MKSSRLNRVLDDVSQYLERELDEGRNSLELPTDSLEAIAKEIASCKNCGLWETRTKVVPGQGSTNPEIMFVGEAPGADEDRQGVAFIGRAGQLLTKMIEAMGYKREEVFIGNILKCRPPGNRTPLPDEMATCLPYLKRQIACLKPKVIIAMGATAVKGLLNVSMGITKLRGTWLRFEDIDLMPTYHPAYLLRNPSAKKDVWEDLKEVLRHLGRDIPAISKAKSR